MKEEETNLVAELSLANGLYTTLLSYRNQAVHVKNLKVLADSAKTEYEQSLAVFRSGEKNLEEKIALIKVQRERLSEHYEKIRKQSSSIPIITEDIRLDREVY